MRIHVFGHYWQLGIVLLWLLESTAIFVSSWLAFRWLGTETPLTPVGDNLWRVGKKNWSPERASFTNFIDGRPQTLIFSGEKFLRHDV